MINGIINIHKEAGFTSHDVVAKMRGICGQKKIGHTGTLDPQATGVLPVCLGSATKLCDMLTDKDKEYVAELLLGQTTDTQDVTGRVLSESPVEVSEEQVRAAVLSFVGDYDQVPPMYSALKVNGKKLYELAREGKEVERQARQVKILEIEILEIQLPVVKMRVACSKGTYIRTLCADIGEKLGCGGTMKSLVRTRVSEFTLENAVTLGELQAMKDAAKMLCDETAVRDGRTAAGSGGASVGGAEIRPDSSTNEAWYDRVILPVDMCFAECPKLHVQEKWRKLLENGNSFYPNQTAEGKTYPEEKWVRVYREDESFAGIYAYDKIRRWYKPVKMFL